ncbi:hypothetical protein [Skermania piniformis]|uniref:SCO6045-like C-terminal domain-containing protein n=1 Tax=Skermania pinensis TaxID=39122 RepID=A0ABX8S802_9ACTN|nr:hypothetical protein [Skermania piniformis]QXQ13888.1 hypothetical protein KV203_19320 [Skermania piniformis]
MSLAQEQAALVRALVADGPVPPGFDAADLAVTARALLHKRADEVAQRYPMLVAALGADYLPTFTAWAAGRPKTSTAADGRAFAAHAGVRLRRRSRLFRRRG